jgi:hypothetical protein
LRKDDRVGTRSTQSIRYSTRSSYDIIEYDAHEYEDTVSGVYCVACGGSDMSSDMSYVEVNDVSLDYTVLQSVGAARTMASR